jgi:hypothetical protein
MATIFVRSNSDAWANGILKDDWDVTGRLRSDGIASCIVSFLKKFFFLALQCTSGYQTRKEKLTERWERNEVQSRDREEAG